jgi:hypothetical protein
MGIDTGPSNPLQPQFVILHFHRSPAVFSQMLRDSYIGQRLRSRGFDVMPSWANGAKVLIEGFGVDDLHKNGQHPTSLRPWHVIADPVDVPGIFRLLQSLPYHQRPRAKAKLSRCGLMKRKLERASVHLPMTIEPSNFLRSVVTTCPSAASSTQPAGEEPTACLDRETAAAISKAIAESFFEELGSRCACEEEVVQVRNTFVHLQEDMPESVMSVSAKTHLTA